MNPCAPCWAKVRTLRRAITAIHDDAEPLAVDDQGIPQGGYLVAAGSIERATALVTPGDEED